MKAAFRIEDYHEAKSVLQKLADEIEVVNRSAAQSLREGLEETLTLHRLNIPPALRISFATTNPIESLNAELDRRLKKVKKLCQLIPEAASGGRFPRRTGTPLEKNT